MPRKPDEGQTVYRNGMSQNQKFGIVMASGLIAMFFVGYFIGLANIQTVTPSPPQQRTTLVFIVNRTNLIYGDNYNTSVANVYINSLFYY